MNLEEHKRLMAELRKRKEELNKNLQEAEKFKGIPIDNELKSDVVNITTNLISSLQPFLEQLGQFQKTFLGADKSDFNSFKNYINSRPDLLNLSDSELAKIIELYSKAEEDDSQVSNRFCCLENDSCNPEIIKAHSIQENGELDIISDFIGNKQQVYHLSRTISDGIKTELKHVSNASTFYGMCKDHDREVFKPIDNNSFADDNQKLFLQSVRAFFFSYYRTIVYQQRNLRYLQAFQDSFFIDLVELKVTRFERNKSEIENAIHQGTNNNLAFLRWTIPHICPLACSSWTTIHLPINDSIITVSDGSIKTGYPIILTVLPSKETKSTSVVLGRFISDISSECIFNQFRQKCKNHDEFGRLISHLVLRATENFYLNPTFYNSLSEMDKKTIESLATDKSAFFSGDKIDFSKQFNFFDEKVKIDVQR